jgi:hypothetical protein
MSQLLHIFRKDVRGLKGELAVFFGVLVLGRLAITSGPEYLDRSEMAIPAEVLTLLAACYLIARLIHADGFANGREYWLTRPYRWKSFLGAKLLFLIVCLHVPVFVSQVALLYAEGFPMLGNLRGLLWSQFLMLVVVSMPVAAVAAVTAGLASFTAVSIAAVALWSSFDLIRSTPWVRRYWFSDSQYFYSRIQMEETEWVRYLVLAVAVAVAAWAAVCLQYKSRRTAYSRALLLAIGFFGLLSYTFVSVGFRWKVQSQVSRQTLDTTSWRFFVVPESQQSNRHFLELPPSSRILTHRSLFVDGVPEDIVEVQVQNAAFDFRASDGELLTAPDAGVWLANTGRREGFSRGPGPRKLDLMWSMSALFYEKVHASGGTLRGRLDLVLFGNERSVTIPASSLPANVTDSFRCTRKDPPRNAHPDKGVMTCRAALRWPVHAVSGSVSVRPESFSPFPADLRLDPIRDKNLRGFFSESADQIKLSLTDPVSFKRVTFEIPNVTLGGQ